MTSTDVKNKAVEVIKTYMGTTMAEFYINYYQDKDDKIILVSVGELLSEYMGDPQAKEILAKNALV